MEKVESSMEKLEPELNVKKSKDRRPLWIAIVVLVLFLLALLVVVIALAATLGVERSRTDPLCLNESCVQLSAWISAAIDPSVDPCTDFYRFSCGKWINKTILGPGESFKLRAFEEPMNDINARVIQLLEEDDDGGVLAVRKVFDLYQSCIDTETIDQLGSQPLLDLIASRLGGWSLINIPKSEVWNTNSSGYLYQVNHGSPSFFEIVIDFDSMNSSRYIITLTQPFSSMINFNDSSNREAYKRLIVRVLSLLHPNGDLGTFETAANEIIEFTTILDSISLKPEVFQDLDRIYNLFTFEEIQARWQYFDWIALIRSIYNSAGYTALPVENIQVIVATPMYFDELGGVLQNTTNEVLQNYAKWLFALQNLRYLSSEYEAALNDLIENITGSVGTQSRIEQCVGEVQTKLPVALARPYIKRYVDRRIKEAVARMIDIYKKTFKDRLRRVDWIDELSLQRSIDKVNAIGELIAYPEQIFNDDYLNGLSADYEVQSDDYFGNNQRHFDLLTREKVGMLIERVDRTMWPREFSPLTINAAYSPNLNIFIFLVGILREPVFSFDWPDYYNFGSLGFIVGHELTHGFDDIGQQFDPDGIRRQWWSDESITEFVRRQDCFIDQYASYTHEGFPIDGHLTLGENIADNGALNTGYEAYQTTAKDTLQRTLPALPYTPDQLYFIAAGQIWCSIYTPQEAFIQSITDVHSPGPLRVLGPMSNSKDFSKVFNCPVGTRMNPPNKCVIW